MLWTRYQSSFDKPDIFPAKKRKNALIARFKCASQLKHNPATHAHKSPRAICCLESRGQMAPQKKDKDRREGKGRRCCLGDGIDSIPCCTNLYQYDLKKRMNRVMATWWNGCFEKMDDHSVHTIPNPHPSKMDVLPKTFIQIILATKWLVRHSSRSSKQQRRPFTSLQYKSFFNECPSLSQVSCVACW